MDGEKNPNSTGPNCQNRVACVTTIICCFLYFCTLGFIYSFGNFTPYLTSYLRRSTGENLRYTNTLWISQTVVSFECLIKPAMGLLSTKMKFRPYLSIAVLFTALSFGGSYWAVQRSYPLTIVTYGILGGVPHSIVGPVLIGLTAKWVPQSKGLFCGLIMAGYGFGNFAWSQLITWYINPHNLQPDVTVDGDKYYSQAQVLDRVPGCFIILGAIFTGIALLSIILIREPSSRDMEMGPVDDEKTKLLQASDDEDSSHNTPDQDMNSAKDPYESNTRDYHPKEVLKSRAFWTIWSIQFFTGQSNMFVMNLFKAYGQTFIKDDHFLSLVASFSGIANAAGRPFWGMFADRKGFRFAALCAQCCLGCIVATFVSCEVTGRVPFFVWVCAMFACMCAIYTITPALILIVFGPKYANTNIGLMQTNSFLGAILNATVAPSLKDTFGWHGMFFTGFVCVFLGILANISLDVRCGKKNKDDRSTSPA